MPKAATTARLRTALASAASVRTAARGGQKSRSFGRAASRDQAAVPSAEVSGHHASVFAAVAYCSTFCAPRTTVSARLSRIARPLLVASWAAVPTRALAC